jgi:hypothetical protein
MQLSVQRFERDGYAISPGLIAEHEAAITARALDRLNIQGAGTRNLLQRPWCRALVNRVKARLVTAGVLESSFVAVQCTLFDKTPQRNWLVTLHQDLSIPVKASLEHPSLRAWSEKEGELFVQPPVEVLEKLVAVRVHIDDCGPENGPLRVVPRSHRRGRLSNDAARELRAGLGEQPCFLKRGDAMLMRPLILHASSKATAPARRRVLHMVFGPSKLPFGLEWKHAV